MPLREDLLEPIAGENPSGANLYYDKLFDQIREARTEEEEVGSAGAWERAAKKADHVLVIKLAGETLARRTKDLRLAGWLVEAHLRKEGLLLFVPCLELLWKLQDNFWDTIYPEIDEDGDLGLRVTAVEWVVNRFTQLVKTLPVTRSGYSANQYLDSRRVGYEEAADTSEKKAARQDAIDQGQLTPEEFDTGFIATPKPFFVSIEAALISGLDTLDQLGAFHESKYGDDYPSMNRLLSVVGEVKQVVSALLTERRKTDPDIVEEPEADPAGAAAAEDEPAASSQEEAAASSANMPQAAAADRPVARRPAPQGSFSGVPATAEQASSAVLQAALFLFEANPQSPAAYLVCAGLRLGETREQGTAYSPEFGTAPLTETRQTLRRLAAESEWAEVMKLGLRTLGEPCGRAWLDLQRYLWRASVANGAEGVATAILSTVRGLLQDLPEMRTWMLDDDTPAANAETQQWLDAEVLPKAPPPVEEPETVQEETPVWTPAPTQSSEEELSAPDVYEQATQYLRHGKTAEAIKLLAREAELQPSGRTRFQRRVQVAQMCLAADQATIAQAVLLELSKEIERRGLETWESGEMLAHPLSLLLRSLNGRDSTAVDKELLFDRICRLDPEAALGIRV